MSRKRTKQYLTLLMVIGLVSIAAGGSGTFASFNAEVTNSGNYFATGSLFLHDTVGNSANTCTSESASTNLNDGTNGDTCDTIFSIAPTDSDAHYAELTLANAGSINASAIQFKLKAACQNARYYESNTTLNGALSVAGGAITSFPIHAATKAVQSGDTIQVDDGGSHVQLFTLTQPLNVGDTTAHFSSVTPNFDYADSSAVSSAANFGASALCDDLQFNITETDSSFTTTAQNNTGTTGALGCAYGTATGLTDGCLFDSSPGDTLGDLPTTLTPLSLSTSSVGNTNDELDAGQARYFLIGIKPDTTATTNAEQDSKATFDVVWHIDQT
jgi:predicted ribosomally synthesized peptide with SipW-like signal peptide